MDRRTATGDALDLLEKRREPEGGDAELLQVIDFVEDTLEIAAPIFLPVLMSRIIELRFLARTVFPSDMWR
jgi:hypothetical protein